MTPSDTDDLDNPDHLDTPDASDASRTSRNSSPVGSYLMIPMTPVSVNLLAELSKEEHASNGNEVYGGTTDCTDGRESLSHGFNLTHAISLRVLPSLDADGQECIVMRSGTLLTVAKFRRVRQQLGAWILTNEPEKIRSILGLGEDDGIKTQW